jgi:hypothetical protein
LREVTKDSAPPRICGKLVSVESGMVPGPDKMEKT